MGNIPPEYEPVMRAAMAELAKQNEQMGDDAILDEVFIQLVDLFINNGKPPEGFNPHHTYYVAQQLTRVVKKTQGIAKLFPPTHRKGMGKDGGKFILSQDDWAFYFNGADGSTVDLTDDPTGGFGEGFDFDWAPEDERNRAQAMLQKTAREMGFGPGDDPLPFVREVAKRLGGRWGLNGKRGDPNNPSKDVLAWKIPGHPPQLFDVVGDSGESNHVQFLPLRYGPRAVWIEA